MKMNQKWRHLTTIARDLACSMYRIVKAIFYKMSIIIRDQKGSPMQEPLSIFLKIGKPSTFVIPKHF